MVREKPSGAVQLKLLIPAALRKKEMEVVVIRNLHTYFKHAAAGIQQEISVSRRNGLFFVGLGFLIMILTAYIGSISRHDFFMVALQVVLEPSGWFMVWTGMDNVLYNSRRRKPNLRFNEKMAHAEIIFLPY
jgi:hypothetical protein